MFEDDTHTSIVVQVTRAMLLVEKTLEKFAKEMKDLSGIDSDNEYKGKKGEFIK